MTRFFKRRRAAVLFALASLTFMTAQDQRTTAAMADAPPPNPLLAPWTGPYGGVPPFDKVKISDFKPALEAAMKENLDEI